jgi:two-component system CAI-1 autoinducer sensor kinase/phosphatase CqsS
VAGPLLNDHRLESYRRLGLLEELITDYLPEIQRLIDTVSAAVIDDAFDRVQEALHSLLGMSGEAGAQALYQCVRRVYVIVQDERRVPPAHEWLPQLRALADRSELALREFTTARRADTGAA